MQRFDKPILQAQQLQAGVYKTFSEFINNNPSVKQYEFKKNKKVAILYTRTGDNDWLPERKAFGYCDGKVIWINAANVFRPLVRQGNTFEFLDYSYPEILRNRRSSVYFGTTQLETLAGSLLLSGANSLFDDDPGGKIVYQLNMENGEY